MQNKGDLHTTIRNILLPHPYYVVRWWIEEREEGYEDTLEEAVDWVRQEGLGSSEDLKEVVKEVLDKIIQEGEISYKKYEREARNFIRQILAFNEEEEKEWAIRLGSAPYTSYPEIVQSAVWQVEEWAAVEEDVDDLSPEASVVYFLRGTLLKHMVADVLSEIVASATSERAKEILENYIDKEIKKLFKELEQGELCISSSEECKEILKTRLLEKDIFTKVEEKLSEEGFDLRVIEDEPTQLLDEVLDYSLERREEIKTFILRQQTIQNLWKISL